ncbi:MAG: NAD(+) synthase [Armatimonadetes bacterium]|nr:NAD(+) synthase [Armatimonadota bacterium]
MGEWRASEELLARMSERDTRRASLKELEDAWYALEDRTTRETGDLISRWIREVTRLIGADGVVLGLSGGVDSSLACVLLREALPAHSLALLMPSGNPDPKDREDALRLISLLGVPSKEISLDSVFSTFLAAADPGASLAEKSNVRGNILSRLRNAFLYYEANVRNYLVFGTGDLDEAYIGYSTKGTTADIFPLSGLHKSEIRALLRISLEPYDGEFAKYLSEKPATPGYWIGQKAEDELGLSYEEIGKVLDVVISGCNIQETGIFPQNPQTFQDTLRKRNIPDETVFKVCDLMMRNFHKVFHSPALWRFRA